jgi:hypothetical protein
MKNIHLLPTDKPSRLCINGKNQMHIYITNDEEIKEGDWIYNEEREPSVIQCIGKGSLRGWRKIILTTDQDLIADGVQAIEDDFLEWFVNNPSCEFVEVSYEVLKPFQSIDKGYILRLPDTDVLEKPKQETIEKAAEEYYIDNIFCDGITEFEHDIAIRCYIAGAKHTTERMYSEEDLREAFKQSRQCKIFEKNMPPVYESFEEWLEEFKKK